MLTPCPPGSGSRSAKNAGATRRSPPFPAPWSRPRPSLRWHCLLLSMLMGATDSMVPDIAGLSRQHPTRPGRHVRAAAGPQGCPASGWAAYVARGVSAAAWRYRATVIVHAPAAVIAERLPAAVGPVEVIDGETCVVNCGADSLEMLAAWLGMLGADFTVQDSPELVTHLRLLADRYRRAADP